MSFDAHRLVRLGEIERWHFWFMGRRMLTDRLLSRYLPGSRTVMDIGCGTGWLVEDLSTQGYAAIGLDFRPEGLLALRQRSPAAVLIRADAANLPMADNSLHGVILSDVLEHVDDTALMLQVHAVLRPRGIAVVSVPAIPWLWSYRDIAAGHRRRYLHAGLLQLLQDSGMHVLEMRYYQFLLLPIVVISRLLGRRGPALRDMEDLPGPLVNRLLGWITRAEVQLSQVVSWPAGTSLVAVCRK